MSAPSATYHVELREPDAWFFGAAAVPLSAHRGTLHVSTHAVPLRSLRVSRGLGRQEYILTTPRLVLTIRPSPPHLSDWPRVVALLRPPPPYQLLQRVGAGAFGAVHRARRRDGALVAVKRVPKRALRRSPPALRAARREGVVAQLLPRHPNLVRTLEARESPTHFVTVMELVEGGTLLDAVRRGALPAPAVACVMRQLLAAVAHMHRHGVVHRDVKLENVLLCDRDAARPRVKLCDLGLAIGADRLRTAAPVERQAGTCYAQAPEIVFDAAEGGAAECGPQIDVWACGVVLFALLFRRVPWSDSPEDRATQMGRMRKVSSQRRPSVDVLLTDEERQRTPALLLSLLAGLLHPDPTRRLTARAALEHGVFDAKPGHLALQVGGGAFGKHVKPVLRRNCRSFRRLAMIVVAAVRTIGSLQSANAGKRSGIVVVM